ncbi:MAG: C4-type zinc ribbon domain-containing protein [Actinomycetota bacterium]|nr:C4-type zinc ribbon domain-containing protein [Actinomycetota bacterium]
MSAPALEALLAVQELDTAADQARHRLGQLPARRQLQEIRQRRRDLAARRSAAEAAREDVAGRQQALEEDLAATEKRRSEVSARLYSGAVSASRDLQALSAEVDGLTARASQLEDEGLAVLEEREPFDAAVAQLDAEEAALAGEEDRALAALGSAEADTGAEVHELLVRRAEAAASVPPDLLATYDHLRARLGGVGAARLVGDRCGGCHLSLPATELDRVRHLPAEAVVTCDQCGRILVR